MFVVSTFYSKRLVSILGSKGLASVVFPCSDTQYSSEPVATEGEAQGEDVTQTNTEEDTSCKSNSTIEPMAEPTESTANDNQPSPTGNNNGNDSQVQNDSADVQTESKVYASFVNCTVSL